jgi:hypothetical protein
MLFRSVVRVYHSAMAMAALVFMTAVTKVFAPRGSFPFVVFPRTGLSDDTGTALANPAAAKCAALETEVDRWAVAEADIKCSRLSQFRIRLPVGYENCLHQPTVDGDGEHLGHIVGSWCRRDSDGKAQASPSVSFWIGSDEGYPTVGMPPGTRQVALRECSDMVDGVRVQIARFILAEVRQNESYWIAAYWALREDLVITALWSGPDALAEREGLAIIRSMYAAPVVD